MSRSSLFSVLAIVLCLFVVATSAWAQTTGKIRGKVKDQETGEPLIGANVAVEGTTLGAAANLDGTYIILTVPPGRYVLRASFIGYQTITVSNVKVNIGLTTELDFRLPSEAIVVPTVEIVAEAPLVNKSATNTVATIRAEDIEILPLRGVAAFVGLSAGIVRQGGDFFVRGGRAEETAFYMDGVLVNNPINGRLTLNIINNAIEQVQTQIGGMTAEYGNAMSGIVNTTSKIGGPRYSWAIEAITDELGGKTSRNIFDAYSYGLNEYVLTAGGPLIPGSKGVRFFVAGQRIFNRSTTTFLDGINFPVLIDSTAITGADFLVVNSDSIGGVTTAPTGSTGNRTFLANLLNNTDIRGGRRLGGVARDSWALQGNLYFDFSPFNLKVGGSYNTQNSIDTRGRGDWIQFNQDISNVFEAISIAAGTPRGFRTEFTDATVFAKITHVVDPSTFYSLNLNYYRFKQETGDQVWFDDIESYGDPSKNPQLVGPSRNPATFSVWSFTGSWPNNVSRDYTKIFRANLGGRFDFVHQFGTTWDFRLGGEITRYTIRSYSVRARQLFLGRLQNPGESDWLVYNNARLSAYGYDIYGDKFDGGTFTDRTGFSIDLPDEGPRHPVLAGAYIQNKFEFDDLIFNAGLRFDLIDPGWRKFESLENIQLDSFGGVPIVSSESLAEQEVYKQVSPRLGFSFPVTDRTVFHATYGKMIQLGRLSDLYTSRMTWGFFFNGGFAVQLPNPSLRPERTTDYEVGFRQQLGEVASFDITFFYKDIKDLHVIRVTFPQPGSEVGAWFSNVNGDFGTSKGLSFIFTLRRRNRLAMNANYTLSSSLATGSRSGNQFNIAWQDNSFNNQPYFPVIPAPTEFDRTHLGNINVDYRFAKGDGPTLFNFKPLERVGLNLLFTFSSGIRYTTSQVSGIFSFSSTNAPFASENTNTSSGPWIYQLDLKLDKTITILGDIDFNVYLWVTNLFNRRNVVRGVNGGTGEPENDGWFTTTSGQQWAENNGPDAVTLYNYLQDNLTWFGTPRIVRLGVRLTM